MKTEGGRQMTDDRRQSLKVIGITDNRGAGNRAVRKSGRAFWFVLLSIILCSVSATGAPSGGPYGPVKAKYELPKVTGKIYYVSPDGNAEEPGETLEKPTTIEAAIKRVVTGDAIVMRGGVYRTGGMELNQGITMQPYADEQPIMKGTLVADKWERQRNGLWTTKWGKLFPEKAADWWRRDSSGRTTPPHRFNNDIVFVDGRFLQSAGWEGEVNENSYYIDYDAKKVYLSIDPAKRLVEITAFNDAITRVKGQCHGKKSDGKGPVIRGITFTQYAYRALEVQGTEPAGLSDESKHGKEVTGTVLEDCTISYCSRVAGYFRGDNMIIRRCLVSDTSTEGIYIIASSDVLLEKNIFRRNNIENISGYFPAAVKIFNQSYRVTCRDNLVTEQPNSNGIWYDVGNVDGVFADNWVEGVGSVRERVTTERFWPSNSGFFFEISKGATVAGNVFVNCDQGIRVLNSNDVNVYNNTLVNSAVFFGRNERSAVGDHFGWHPSTGPDVNSRDGHIFVNNLLTSEEDYRASLLVFWQPGAMCKQLVTPQVKWMDYNVYVRAGEAGRMILWSPAQASGCQEAFDSPDELNKKAPEFSKNSRSFVNYNGPLFKSAELGNYQLLAEFTGSKPAGEAPDVIRELLGMTEKDKPYIGAYPAMDAP